MPPLLPAHAHNPTDLSLAQRDGAQKVEDPPPGDPQHRPETDALGRSEHEPESFGKMSGAWEPKAWPEGRQVLTHLVDGFVIQEGLQPFPVRTRLSKVALLPQTPFKLRLSSTLQVNRSSLLVPGEVTKPQEVNGTNGSAASPVPEATKPMDASSDSEQDEAGDTDESTTSKSLSSFARLGRPTGCFGH